MLYRVCDIPGREHGKKITVLISLELEIFAETGNLMYQLVKGQLVVERDAYVCIGESLTI